MDPEKLRQIEKLLAGSTREEVRQGLELAKAEIARCGPEDAREAIDAVTSLFYIDPLDRPDLKPCIDEAVDLVIGFGRQVIPNLLETLDEGDVKAQLVVANALGRIGADALEPLLEAYRTARDHHRREFALYAIGHIRSPKVVAALPLVLEGLEDEDPGMRDTATRAIGRMAEAIPAGEMPEDLRDRIFRKLILAVSSPSPAIRAKAVRSLGKLVQHGHLTDEQKESVRRLMLRILGEDEDFEWDHAYIVRKEAREAMRFCC